jgi:hypothetical protein
MKKVESRLPIINAKKRTIEISMRIIRKERRLASGNQAAHSPVDEKINTPSPPGMLPYFFASKSVVG